MTHDFRFEDELSRATTLPAEWYLDGGMLAREQEAVFSRTWQLAGHASQLAHAGDAVAVEVAGEPLVVVRGEDDTLRAFSGVCRHRAGPVRRGPEGTSVLRCGYHGWTYGLDGHLRGTPEFEGVEDFEPRDVRLPEVRLETWASLVFVNLDPAAPALAETLGAIPRETAPLGVEGMRPYRRHDYEIDCNWKVYVDNYLEGYHIPVVHPGLFRELDYGAYRVDVRRRHLRQHAPVRSPSPDSLYRRHLDAEEEPEALYYWVFPNLMLNVYPDNLQLNIIVPLGPERTSTRFEWLVPDPGRPGLAEEFERSFAFSDEVQREDIGICEAVQKGLRSRFYDRGRFSVRRENGVHHFHGLLASALDGQKGSHSG